MQPAWVLNRRPYGDNSLLLEFFTANDGRCSALVRGVRQRRPGGHWALILQLFSPVLITLSGRGELKNLKNAEASSPAYRLEGNALICGLYLNELLVNALPKFEAHPDIFLAYSCAIEALVSDAVEPILRRFELTLLNTLGYQIDWMLDEDGNPIIDGREYQFEAGRGFYRETDSLRGRFPPLQGACVRRIQKWVQHGGELLAPDATDLKLINRQSINYLTGGKLVKSRELFLQAQKPPQ